MSQKTLQMENLNFIGKAASVYQRVRFLRILPCLIAGAFLGIVVILFPIQKFFSLHQGNWVPWIIIPYILYVVTGAVTTILVCVETNWELDSNNAKNPINATLTSNAIAGICLIVSSSIMLWPLFTWGALIGIVCALLLAYGLFLTLSCLTIIMVEDKKQGE